MKKALDTLFQSAIADGTAPGIVSVVTAADGTRYEGAFGRRALESNAPMSSDSVLWWASMTKAVTAAAVMQLVERGLLDLDTPAADVVPELGRCHVLRGFAEGQPVLSPPKKPVTLRRLLTHTAGFGYEFSSAEVQQFQVATQTPSITTCTHAALQTPLLFEPGERWEYGTGIDWAGRMLEEVSGQSLGAYLEQHLTGPLGMRSTSFKLSDDQRRRRAGMHLRSAEGRLDPMDFELPQTVEFEMGGGGLNGTILDYSRFLRALLRGGELEGKRVLEARTVELMFKDQVPSMDCGRWETVNPILSNATDFFQDQDCGWGLSFLINRHSVPGGRAPRSLSWAGLSNCYYWIDPTRGVAAVLGTQILPFFDARVVELFRRFEQLVYAEWST